MAAVDWNCPLTVWERDLRMLAGQPVSEATFIGRLMHDESYADALLQKINSAATHADSILRKVDSGKGTLGGIINDPEVYQGLKDVVSGIQQSRVGKGIVRHYGKKGAKERAEGEEGESGKDQGKEGAQPGEPQPQPTP